MLFDALCSSTRWGSGHTWKMYGVWQKGVLQKDVNRSDSDVRKGYQGDVRGVALHLLARERVHLVVVQMVRTYDQGLVCVKGLLHRYMRGNERHANERFAYMNTRGVILRGKGGGSLLGQGGSPGEGRRAAEATAI